MARPKKKPTQPDVDDDDILGIAHTSDGKPRANSDDSAIDTNYRITADELREYVEKYERLEIEKQDIAAAQKEVMAEAKGRGYDTKIMRKLIAMRKRDASDIAEEQAILDMYLEAMGM